MSVDRALEFGLATATTGRSAVLAPNGMVASAHPLASAAGLRVLQDGGNAVDAALAAAMVTWVTMPMMCGPGGDAFLVIYCARTGRLTAINGSGGVGRRATPDFFRARGHGRLPQDGYLSAAIPGAVDAMEQAMLRFGTRGWADLLQPAIRYAEGHPVTEKVAGWFAKFAGKLARFPSTAAIYLRNGRPPREGEILVQADLAATLRALARGGAREFYQGALAEAITRYTATEGLFDAGELAAHASEVYTPIKTTYRGYEIHQTAPPSQGMILLEEMNILEGFDLAGLGNTAAAHHLMIEAKKLAFADRNRWAGDPRLVEFPLQELIGKEHAARQRARIDPARAMAGAPAGDPLGDTTYLCAVDRDGNAVSLIHSISNAFGAGVVVPGTGILLNNRAGRGFQLRDGHPNQIAPGKRTMHTLNCYIVTKDGYPYLVGGTSGGDGQPQWNMQALVHVIDFGLNVQQAAEAPRWSHTPGTDPDLEDTPPVVSMESRFSPAVIEGLRAMGHPVQVVGPWQTGGSVQLIQVDRERGVLAGGSDPRVDGAAMGY